MKLTRQEAEEFLYREARLLDERKYEEWLKLFAPEGTYWIPMEDGIDPTREPSILYDDSALRAQRVYQLLHQPHYAQMPPSRTIHFISNVESLESDDNNGVIGCHLLLYELRSGDNSQFGLGAQRSLAGHCEYRLRYDGGWLIILKKIMLINRDLPISNLTFIM